MATVDSVKELINQDKVVIFSKTYCPYCDLAKDVFKKINQKYTVFELDKMSQKKGSEMQAILGNMTGARTVPRVFINGQCIGGGSDVKALAEKGELKRILA